MAGNLNLILIATEEWIKDKLNIETSTLDAFQSLSLPGKYHEKITHIGRSLISFTSLRQLDLSRNALETLEGLEHLKQLESLNLYYNNIPSLREVFRLRHNTKLKDIDLRLNPVTKNEPDYRLFVVHMLIHLRKLDEKSVTDGERKAALMHFDTDQAYEFENKQNQEDTHSGAPQSGNKLVNCAQPRVQLVQSMASKRQGLGIDTEELMDMMAERGVVGGTVFVQVEGQRDNGRSNRTRQDLHVAKDSPSKTPTRKKPLSENTRSGNKILPHPPVPIKKDLKESEAFTIYQPKVNYTPHPSSQENEIPKPETRKATPTMERLIELKIYEEMRQKEEEIAQLKGQLEAVKGRVATIEEVEQREKEIEKMLRQTHSDMTLLHQNCQSLLTENISLKKAAVASIPEKKDVSGHSELRQLIKDIRALSQQQQVLSGEIHKLSERQSGLLSHSSQLQGLAAMLQESHKSLVTTNTRLLQDIEELKHQHALEISQLHTNYEQLRKTLQKMKL